MPPQKSVCLLSFSDFGLGRGEYLAKAMKAIGLEVLVVTNRPVYVASSKMAEDELNKDKIDIVEIPLPRLPYNAVVSRLVLYLFFTIFSFLILLKSRRSFTFYYSRGPQPFTEITCYILKLLKGGKIVSDITDLWPDALEYVEMNSFLKRIFILFGHAINSLIWSKLDAIVTHNEMMAHILSIRSNIKVYVIHGIIDLDKFKPVDKKEALEALPKIVHDKISNKFVILYAGLLGSFQNPLMIIELAKKMLVDDKLVFLIVGTGPLKKKMEQEVKKFRLSNIVFLETLPFDDMPLVYNLADLLLLTYAPIKFLSIGLPKKFVEYASIGKPILCITPTCVASKLCTEWKAGYHFLPHDLENVTHVIQNLEHNVKLRKLLGNNARKMAQSLFSLEEAKKRLQAVLDSLK